METPRIKPLAIASLLAIAAPSSLLACGGWSEEAPPTLDVYLDRLPAKSLGQIFVETTPSSESKTPPSINNAIKRLSEQARTEPAEKLIAKVDSLLAQYRAAGGEHECLALLHDLRDGLVAAPHDFADYIQWRLDNTSSIKPETERDPYRYGRQDLPAFPSSLAAEIEKNASTAVEPLRAHWIYLRGAVVFNYGNKTEAQKWFDRVVAEYPSHPRAEIALFMSGRCLLSQSREEADFNQPREEWERITARAKAKRGEAIARFREYLGKYPQGRFVADAYGWLGALEDGVTALDDYIRQVETPDHPEVLKSGIFMIQKCLDNLSADDPKTDEAIALVAKHPRVAIGTLYLVLGAHHGRFQPQLDSNQSAGPSAKKWRTVILPKLAAAVAAQKELYVHAEDWTPRYLSILAHAASNTGDHANALKLTRMTARDLATKSDDLLFARAIVLQRAGQAAEAIEAFREFLAEFPQSPLAAGARIRFAIALRDNHQAGEAVLELKKLPVGDENKYSDSVYPPADSAMQLTDSPIYPDISNAESSQVTQVIDVILNFAPLAELEAALGNKEIDPALAEELRAIIAQRALAHEDFTTARRVMTPEQFGLIAKNLETLTGEVSKARNSKQKAEAQAKLGDAWAAARGQLLKAPLDSYASLHKLFKDQVGRTGLNRRTNGRALGFRNIETELDERDELRHASRWWLRAARNGVGTSVAAPARLKTLEAIPKIAGSSDYAFGRALEDEMEKVSREIYDKLQTEAPDSNEAKQAAYWTVVRLERSPNSNEFDYSDVCYSDRWYENRMRRRAGYFWSDYELQGGLTSAYNDDGGDLSGWKGVGERINALRYTSKSAVELTKEINDLHQIVSTHYNAVSQAACLNFLDDLMLLLGEPGITDEIARRYINLRLDVLTASSWHPAPVVPPLVGITRNSEDYTFETINAQIRERIRSAAEDPAMKPAGDYLKFLEAALVANSGITVRAGKNQDEQSSFSTRDYPSVEKITRALLSEYPHSRKREAARVLLARAVYRQSWPRIETVTSEPGEISFQERRWERLDPKRVLAELDAHDQEFPNGRYAPEIRDMRASVYWRSGDWKPAINLTVQQLDGGKPDLKRDAVLRLANIFAQLNTAEHRPALIAAIRENPSALAWLKLYLAKAPNYHDHPLRFMTGYLQDQLGFKLPPPEQNPR